MQKQYIYFSAVLFIHSIFLEDFSSLFMFCGFKFFSNVKSRICRTTTLFFTSMIILIIYYVFEELYVYSVLLYYFNEIHNDIFLLSIGTVRHKLRDCCKKFRPPLLELSRRSVESFKRAHRRGGSQLLS